jgi:hypothetical protein
MRLVRSELQPHLAWKLEGSLLHLVISLLFARGKLPRRQSVAVKTAGERRLGQDRGAMDAYAANGGAPCDGIRHKTHQGAAADPGR